jgi:hypothetical protein
LGHADQLLGMKSAKTTRLRPIWPWLTGAIATIAPRGTPYGAADSTARAKASFSLMTVMSPAAPALPRGMGVGPVTTRTVACALLNAFNRHSNAAAAAVPDLIMGLRIWRYAGSDSRCSYRPREDNRS